MWIKTHYVSIYKNPLTLVYPPPLSIINPSDHLSLSKLARSKPAMTHTDDMAVEVEGRQLQNDDDSDLRRGPWTVDEDLTLVNYIASHGEGRWNSLARSAGN